VCRHEKALEGITVCGEFRKDERFQPIIDGLSHGLSHTDVQTQAACLQLINALVTCPDDLDFRLHLRNEFMRIGLHDLMEVHIVALCISAYVTQFKSMNLCDTVVSCSNNNNGVYRKSGTREE
jgi:hypothetical protein